MRKSLFALSALAAALFAVPAAMADGMIKSKGGSMKDGPAPAARECSSGPFAGAFIGGHVGYAWGRSDYSHDSLYAPLDANNDDGFVGGVSFGYNWQCDRLVVGMVSDFSFGDITSKVDYGAPDVLKESINWYGTSRVKVGVAHDHTLFYFTAGLAYADIDWKLSGCCTASNSDRVFGWTIGGGVDFIRDNRWTLGFEVLYVDLGDTNIQYNALTYCGGVCTLNTKWEDDFFVARLNLSIKLGHHEAAHVPMK